MEKLITILLTFILFLIITHVLISLQTQKKVNEQREWAAKLFIESVNLDSNKVEIDDVFSEAVLFLYREILADPNKYYIKKDGAKQLCWGDSISIWGENSINYRRFHASAIATESEAEVVRNLNANLTPFDKLLLDKLVTAVANRTEKLVTKFFV